MFPSFSIHNFAPFVLLWIHGIRHVIDNRHRRRVHRVHYKSHRRSQHKDDTGTEYELGEVDAVVLVDAIPRLKRLEDSGGIAPVGLIVEGPGQAAG